MNNLNKKLALFIAILAFTSFTLSYADDDMTTTSSGETMNSSVEDNNSSDDEDNSDDEESNSQDDNTMTTTSVEDDNSSNDEDNEDAMTTKPPVITPEMKQKVMELMTSLEKEIATLRASITTDNIEDVKVKAEELKKSYLDKFNEMGLGQFKRMLEERFNIFYRNNYGSGSVMNQYNEQKREEYRELKDDYKEKMKENKNEYKEKKQEAKQNFQDKKQELKMKYKAKFAKALEAKLANFSTDKIKAVIAKIDTVIEKYNSNEALTQDQKDKFVAQLNALKELLQEKIDETENSINIDEILAE